MYIAKLDQSSTFKVHKTNVNSKECVVITPEADEETFSNKQMLALSSIGFRYAGKNLLIQPKEASVKEAIAQLESITSSLNDVGESVMESRDYTLQARRLTLKFGENNTSRSFDIAPVNGGVSISLDTQSPNDLSIVEVLESEFTNISFGENLVVIDDAKLNDVMNSLSQFSPSLEMTLNSVSSKNSISPGSAIVHEMAYKTGAEIMVVPTKSNQFNITEKVYINDRFQNSGKFKEKKIEGEEIPIEVYSIAIQPDSTKSSSAPRLSEKAKVASAQIHEMTGSAPLVLLARDTFFFIAGDKRLDKVLAEHSTSTRERVVSSFKAKKSGGESFAADATVKGVLFEQVYSSLQPLLKAGTNLTESPELADPNRYRLRSMANNLEFGYVSQYFHTDRDAAEIFTSGGSAPFGSVAQAEAARIASLVDLDWSSISSGDFRQQGGGLVLDSKKLGKSSKNYWGGIRDYGDGNITLSFNKHGKAGSVGSINLRTIGINYAYQKLRDFKDGIGIGLSSLKTQKEIDDNRKASELRRLQAEEDKAKQDEIALNQYQSQYSKIRKDLRGSFEFERKNINPIENPNLALERKGDTQVLHALLTIMSESNSEEITDGQIASYQTIERSSKNGAASSSKKKLGYSLSTSETGLGAGRTAIHSIGSIHKDHDWCIGEGVMDVYLNAEVFGDPSDTNYIATVSAGKIKEVLEIAYNKSEGQTDIDLVADNDIYKPLVGNVGMMASYMAIASLKADGKNTENIILHSPNIGRQDDDLSKTPKFTDPSDITTPHSSSNQALKIKRLSGFEGVTVYPKKVPDSIELGYAIDEIDDNETLSEREIVELFDHAIEKGDPFLLSHESSKIVIKELVKRTLVEPIEYPQDLKSLLLTTAEFAPAFVDVEDKIIDSNDVEVNASHPLYQANSFTLGNHYLAVNDEIRTHTGDLTGFIAQVDKCPIEITEPDDGGYTVNQKIPLRVNGQDTIQSGVVVEVDVELHGDGVVELPSGSTLKTKLLSTFDGKTITANSPEGRSFGMTADEIEIDRKGVLKNIDGTPLKSGGTELFGSIKKITGKTIVSESNKRDAKAVLAGEPTTLYLKIGANISENADAKKWFTNSLIIYKNYLEKSGSDHLEHEMHNFADALKTAYTGRFGSMYEERFVDALDHVAELEKTTNIRKTFASLLTDDEALEQFVNKSILAITPETASVEKNEPIDDRIESLKSLLEFHEAFYFEHDGSDKSVIRLQQPIGQSENYLVSFVDSTGESLKELELTKKQIFSEQFAGHLKDIPIVRSGFQEIDGNKQAFSNVGSFDPKEALKTLGKRSFNVFAMGVDTATFNEIKKMTDIQRLANEFVSQANEVEAVERILGRKNIGGELLGTKYSNRFVDVVDRDEILTTPLYTMIDGFVSQRGGIFRNKELYEKKISQFEKSIEEYKNNSSLPPEIVDAGIIMQTHLKEKFIQDNQELISGPAANHTAGRVNQSVAIIPKDLAFYKYLIEEDGDKNIYPSAPYHYKQMTNTTSDIATSIAVKEYDMNKDAADKLAGSISPFYVDSMLTWNLKQSDLDRIKDYWFLRDSDSSDNKLRFSNAKEEHHQFLRMALHDYLSGSPIQSYQATDISSQVKQGHYVYRVNQKSVMEGSNHPFVPKYKELLAKTEEFLRAKNIEPSEKIELLTYSRDTYRKGAQKIKEDTSVYGMKATKDVVPLINDWLAQSKLLSKREFNWINSPSDHPCPYITSEGKGRTEALDRKELAQYAMRTPVFKKNDEGAWVHVAPDVNQEVEKVKAKLSTELDTQVSVSQQQKVTAETLKAETKTSGINKGKTQGL
ncbi:hypothetical protein [Marinomonas sp. 2405UD68-3]|uniref:hypothetical protein n=1 Tax=Marinomonas sp. 2405UD68-3 TaxID=3391835 RepID=UPI0039C9D636